MRFQAQDHLPGLLDWMRGQMAACGGVTAVVGISGGKDSAVTAALCAAAYGKQRVLGVLLPDGQQPDIADAQALTEHLAIPCCTLNIREATRGVLREMEAQGLSVNRQARVNLPSRMRMLTLYAVAQSREGGIVVNTSNLSEDWVGYCTVYGDSAGAFSPLGMYTTEEVVALGEALGLPERLVKKPPSDGLTGRTDEENLGVSYREINAYIRTGAAEPEVRRRIDRLHKASRFKFQTVPVYHNGLAIVPEDTSGYYR